MRSSWWFYLDVIGIALLGAGLGYVIALGKWGLVPLWALVLVTGIPRFCSRYGPGALERHAAEKRRRDAEHEYQRREEWDSWSP